MQKSVFILKNEKRKKGHMFKWWIFMNIGELELFMKDDTGNSC